MHQQNIRSKMTQMKLKNLLELVSQLVFLRPNKCLVNQHRKRQVTMLVFKMKSANLLMKILETTKLNALVETLNHKLRNLSSKKKIMKRLKKRHTKMTTLIECFVCGNLLLNILFSS